MTTHHAEEHGAAETIAVSQVGKVLLCPCGVLTLSMSCVSIRFELAALRDLCALLNSAVDRLEADAAMTDASDLIAAVSDRSSGFH